MDANDKRKKAEPEEIDISNGSLFLMIRNLEREVKYLKSQIVKYEPMIEQSYGQTMRVGGGS